MDSTTIAKDNSGTEACYWKLNTSELIALVGLGLLAVLVLKYPLAYLIDQWLGSEEFSHGTMIPFITVFLIWQKKNELAKIPFTGSWWGIAVLVVGLLLYFLGEFATLVIFQQYAILFIIFGLVLSCAGQIILTKIWVPLAFLLFSVPLPLFLMRGLSAKLQLWSSSLGVYIIQLFDISVFLEGNVIDLGAMRLQVVEACSGLTYLFPLMSVAFMCAYFFQAKLWQRGVVFFSSIPITVLMNSFRIGVIGITVEYWGKAMAEGFLHAFEGWFVFMVCTAILIGEMWLLQKLSRDPRPLMEVFGLVLPEDLPVETRYHERELPRQFWISGGILLVALGLSMTIQQRTEIIPPRTTFAEFPLKLANWVGQRQVMGQEYIDTLKFEDYILADYADAGNPSLLVNFYSAYYSSQHKGESAHSPRSCIPGGGWDISSLQTIQPSGVSFKGLPMNVNRLTIQKGEDRQLVYYWFQQRGRVVTNEYVLKLYLLWDALMMNRSDGALVRLTTYVRMGEDYSAADKRLTDFLGKIQPELDRYIPL